MVWGTRVPYTAVDGNGTGRNKAGSAIGPLPRLYRNGSTVLSALEGKKEGNGFQQEKLLGDKTPALKSNRRSRKKSSKQRRQELESELLEKAKLSKLQEGTDGILLDGGRPFKVTEELRGRLDKNGKRIFKHFPLLDRLSAYINGYHKGRPSPPISPEVIGDIADFLYLSWYVKKHPEDEAAKMELDAHGPNYGSVIITLKGNFMGQSKEHGTFLSKARDSALKAVKQMMDSRGRLDARLKMLETKLAADKAELERETKAVEKWVGELYANRKASYSERLGKTLTPIEEYLKKIGIPAGGALAIAGTAFKSAVQDITEHIPVVSGIPPELVGVGIIGVWLLARLGKLGLNMRMRSAKVKLPMKEEKHKASELEKIARRQLEAEQEYADETLGLKGGFELERQGILAQLKHDYGRMLAESGYARAN